MIRTGVQYSVISCYLLCIFQNCGTVPGKPWGNQRWDHQTGAAWLQLNTVGHSTQCFAQSSKSALCSCAQFTQLLFFFFFVPCQCQHYTEYSQLLWGGGGECSGTGNQADTVESPLLCVTYSVDSLGDAGISLFDKRDVSLSVSPRVNTLYKLFHTLYGKEMEEMGEVSGSFIVCRLLGWLLGLVWYAAV